MTRQNYRRLLVSLTDCMLVWLDEVKRDGAVIPSSLMTNANIVACMAESALQVVVALGEVETGSDAKAIDACDLAKNETGSNS